MGRVVILVPGDAKCLLKLFIKFFLGPNNLGFQFCGAVGAVLVHYCPPIFQTKLRVSHEFCCLVCLQEPA
jgi:hypothetical protein